MSAAPPPIDRLAISSETEARPPWIRARRWERRGQPPEWPVC